MTASPVFFYGLFMAADLVTPPSPAEANREYADQLRGLAHRLGLQPDYVARIR